MIEYCLAFYSYHIVDLLTKLCCAYSSSYVHIHVHIRSFVFVCSCKFIRLHNVFIPFVFRCVPMCRWHVILFYCFILFMNDSVANWFIHIVCCWDSFVSKLIHEVMSLRLRETIIPNSKYGRLNEMTTIFYVTVANP